MYTPPPSPQTPKMASRLTLLILTLSLANLLSSTLPIYALAQSPSHPASSSARAAAPSASQLTTNGSSSATHAPSSAVTSNSSSNSSSFSAISPLVVVSSTYFTTVPYPNDTLTLTATGTSTETQGVARTSTSVVVASGTPQGGQDLQKSTAPESMRLGVMKLVLTPVALVIGGIILLH